MTMEYKQWKEILSAVNKETDLRKDNIIEKIKGELPQDSDEYKEWSKANFDVNYQFGMERMPRGVGYQIGMGPILDLSCTLLGLAAINDYTKVVDILAKAEANPSVASDSKNTPLHWAAYKGCKDIVNLLIKARANLDAVNGSKDTPLSRAAYHNNTEMVNILIKAGTDFLLFDKNGHIRQFLEKKAKKNGLYAGSATELLGTVVAVALFATGTVAVTVAALAVGGITYMLSKPSTEMDEVEKEQGITGDERKA